MSKKIIGIGLVFFLMMAGRGFSQESNQKSLVGYWSFDEGIGNIAKDSSEYKNNGEIYGAEWCEGRKNHGLRFEHSKNYVKCGNPASLQFTGSLTLEAYVSRSELEQSLNKGARMIICKDARSPERGFYLSILPSGSIRMLVSGNGVEISYFDTVKKLSLNKWYHIAGVYDAIKKKLSCFVNGEEWCAVHRGVNDVPSSIYNSKAALRIGGIHRSSSFVGKIDEVKIYNKALSAEEIKSNYEETLPQIVYKHVPFSKSVHYLCKERKSPLRIDGDLSEWEDIPLAILDSESKYYSLENGWGGVSDLWVAAGFLFDKDNLYLSFRVKDDKFYQVQTESKIWRDDSIQLGFDTLNDAIKGKLYDKNDYEYNFALTSKGPSISCGHTALEATAQIKNIKFAAKRIEEGCNYEIQIPWKNLAPFDIRKSDHFGFSFLVNDNDGRGRKGWLEWTPGIGHGKEPASFGRLHFIASTAAEIQFLSINKKEFYDDKEDIEVNLHLLKSTDSEEGLEVKFKIEGESVKYVSKKIKVKKGDNIVSISFPPTYLLPGDYIITGSYNSPNIKPEEISFTFYSREEQEKEMLFSLSAKKNQLQGLVKTAKEKGLVTPYQDVSLITVELFLEWIKQDLEGNNPETRFVDNRLTNVKDELTNSLKVANIAIEEVNQIIKDPTCQIKVPSYKLTNLTIKNGSFYDPDFNPIFLFGITGLQNAKAETREMMKKSFQLNLREILGLPPFKSRMVTTPEEIESAYRKAIDKILQYLDEAKDDSCYTDIRWSLHLSFLFDRDHPEALTGRTNHGCRFDPDNPFAREARKDWFERVLPVIKNHPSLLFHDLANEPYFYSYTDYTVKKYRHWLKDKYNSIEELNKRWQANYKSFEEITPFPHVDKGMKYNWCIFNQHRITDFFAQQKETIKKIDPTRGNIHIKLVNEVTWGLANCSPHHDHGIDQEALRIIVEDVCGCDGRPLPVSMDGEEYASSWISESISFDFMKSLTPSKPIYDSEWHSVEGISFRGPNVPARHIRGMLWLNFLHGMRASTIWYWGRNNSYARRGGAKWFPHSLLTQPQLLDAYGRTSLELRRLANYIIKFSQTERKVRILYSKTSAILDDRNYFSQVVNSYQALNFLDYPVGFLTENQIVKGELKDKKLLIVPLATHIKEDTFQAIIRYVKEGGKVLVIGDSSFNFDEYGRKRNASSFFKERNVKLISVAPRQDYLEIFNEEFDKEGISRPVQVIGDNDQKIWGVELRSVKVKDGHITYLINLTKKEIKVKLKSKRRMQEVKNLINNKEKIDFPFILKPMEPLLLKIN